MAEIQIEYPELQIKIKESIEKNVADNEQNAGYAPLPDFFEAAVLTSLCEKADDDTSTAHQDAYKLWDGKHRTPDQIAFGKNYIIIQDVILEIIQKLIENGIMGMLIKENVGAACTPIDLIKFLNTLIRSLKSLQGNDICLAYRATDHPSALVVPVKIEEISSWFPGMSGADGLPDCDKIDINMHYSCAYFNYEDNSCMITKKGVDDSVESLQTKGILNPVPENEGYRFKW